MKKIFLGVVTCLIVIGLISLGDGMAQAPSIKVTLSLSLTDTRVPDQPVYLLDDPSTQGVVDPDRLKIVLTLIKTGNLEVTSKDFSTNPFHLFLAFTGPDGKTINATKLIIKPHQDPPLAPQTVVDNNDLVQVEEVDTLPNNWVLSITIPDAHAFYPLSNAGRYSVKAIIPMRTYLGIDYPGPPHYSRLADSSKKWSGALYSNTEYFTLVADKDGDGYSYPVAISPPYNTLPDCDDNNPNVNPGMAEIPFNGIDDDCNPLTLDGADNRGMVIIKAERHKVGSGSYPGSTKYPITGMEVRLFDKFSACVAPYSASWQNYEAIWACPSAKVYCYPSSDPADHCHTDGNGMVNMIALPGNYIAIGRYSPSVFIGVSVGGVAAGQTVNKYLQVIEKADGKKVPAKYTVKTGSELLIIEPEYIEWDGTQELYPFVFESVGDWTVTTSVAPPEGFVADQPSLTANVDTTVKAVQFTITDVGSKWEHTKVVHLIKHKGKPQAVTSTVGVKLSEKLAKKKGLSIYGDEDQRKKKKK
jgi:hypothetical protein